MKNEKRRFHLASGVNKRNIAKSLTDDDYS